MVSPTRASSTALMEAARYPHLPGMEVVDLHLGGRENAQFVNFIFFPGGHQPNLVFLANGAIHDAKVNDDPPVAVVVAVKN